MSFGKITARQIWCKSSGYIDTDRFIIHIKTEDFPNYVKDEEKRFKTSNHKVERHLQIIIIIIIIIIKIGNWLV